MSKSALINIIGFSLFTIGFLSIFLSLVGMQFNYLKWLTNLIGNGGALLTHMLMIMAGLILVYINRQVRD